MLRPTPGELLAGIHRELTAAVLPYVPEGEPTRQLRAALHVLAQLQRCWDLQPAYLRADIADLRTSITELGAGAGIVPAPAEPASPPAPGVQDPELAELLAEHERLSAELATFQQAWSVQSGAERDAAVDALLFDLHVRMAARARAAAGLVDGPNA
ncbi:MAG: hypothetical protein ACT4P1_03925 [Sporichthyaceae bacterium]